ncbi:calmodulin-binding protein 60 A-like isoform X1 [Nicotiana tomentosiformis]|uniref:calmodulin-binding protein 60 A-like isoform X1 n=1 Tax=Nicotiana tomentosiformis TaxID=4098 RepID=UPI00388CB4A7
MEQILVFEDGNIRREEGNYKSETSNSRPPFTRVIRDVVSLCKLRRIVAAFLLAVFPFLVEDEFHSDLEIILTARYRNSKKKIHPCERRCLLLRFSHEIAPLVFTGECIFPKETKLELVDAITGLPVIHGPLSSAQVEIFLLKEDLGGDGEELNSYIMMQKRGGKSMRHKNPYLRLQGGIVSVDEIRFKHTPKYMRKLEVVRLGAKVIDLPEEIKVREALTGYFTVKDKHLKSKKRYPPLPTDDIWRLEQIQQNGPFHKRLTENGIRTVEDFLIELYNNPQRLQHFPYLQILGKSMSGDRWKITTRHAKTCNLDGRKASAHKLVETAFANWENCISIKHHLSSSKFSPSSCPTVDDCQHSELQNTSKSHLPTESNQWVVSGECSTSYAIAEQHTKSDGMSLAFTSSSHFTTDFSSLVQNDKDILHLGSFNQIPSMNSDSGEYLEKIVKFLSSDNIQLDDSPYVHSAVIHKEGTNLSNMDPVASMRKGKSKKSWAKIFSVTKWFLLMKRFVKLKNLRITKKRKFS